jgi:hypothetical protein
MVKGGIIEQSNLFVKINLYDKDAQHSLINTPEFGINNILQF